MSTNNAARFYWAKLKRVTTLFDRGALEEAHDVCCQLGNGFRCPRFCQIEAWKLGSRCFPDNYWFARSMLDIALKVVVDCESSDEANDRDMAALAEVKEGVEKMLAERDAEFRQYWEKQGREPPSMEEWYDVMEGGEDDGSTASDDWNMIDGEAVDWPFPPGFVPASALVRKTLPRAERQQDEQHIEAVDLAVRDVVKDANEAAEQLRQLKIDDGVEGDEMEVEEAPPLPVSSWKGETSA